MASQEVKTILSTIPDGRTKYFRYRQRQLWSLHKWVDLHQDAIKASFLSDNIAVGSETQYLIAEILLEIRQNYEALDLKSELDLEYAIAKGQNRPDRKVPENLIYIIPDKYTQLYSVISAVSAAIAAGSGCIVELVHDPTQTNQLLRRCFAEALDPAAYTCVTSRPPANILAKCLIVDQTGGIAPGVGRRLLSSDATAATMAVIDRTANLALAAAELGTALRAFSSKGPYAPRCILINEFVAEEFVSMLPEELSRTFDKPLSAPDSSPASQVSRGHGSKSPAITQLSDRHSDDLQLKVSRDTPIQLLSFSSLDDVIDGVQNKSEQQPLSALYIFSDGPSAKYLAQFIAARVSFVNHIPAKLSIGPAAPIGYAVTPSNRYHRDMFTSPSPQYAHQIGSEVSAGEAFAAAPSQLVSKLYGASKTSLRPPDQPKAGDVNFFLQALLASGVFIVTPIAVFTYLGASKLGLSVLPWLTSKK
ncbi:hypothetical protein EDD36DRAFT_415883 [Exophiala viscosa]|uniref:Aldehyde dehydrogenase domain-containing protein n=1 Tax=Exophiala viscosa TaxID=2486360 RepID=A0AAN6E452_9EURO|nr:hypothetical protein EDD36DRAFT_415883 [Exophiala viscosa]